MNFRHQNSKISVIFCFTLLMFVFSLAYINCTSRTTKIIPITNISLNEQEITLLKGKTKQLKASTTPENATNQEVIWDSSNIQVASISEDGVVTALSEGQATITVSSLDGNHTAECLVTVLPNMIIENLPQWQQAINQISQDHENMIFNITIEDDFSIPATDENSLTFSERNGIIINLLGNNSLSLDINSTGNLIRIGNAQTLTLIDIGLKGHENNITSLVNVSGENTTLNMQGYSSISENTSNQNGGGVYVNNAILNMTDHATINHNAVTGSRYGGGIYAYSANVTLSGIATVANNSAQQGGGIWSAMWGFLSMTDCATVSYNTARSSGGGVDVSSVYTNFTMSGTSSIKYNTSRSGGGASIGFSTVLMTDYATISNNLAIEYNYDGGNGGGVYYTGTNFTMQDNASIFQNTAEARGGGICCNTTSSVFISGNASIYENSAINGGGIYGLPILSDNSTIYGNSATNGGGVLVWGASFAQEFIFEMNDNSSIYGNNAIKGGGV